MRRRSSMGARARFVRFGATIRIVIAGLDPAIVRAQARSIQGGASPLQVILLRPVADRNCVTVRWGGEQREATESSVAQANSIRPCCLASLRLKGEAQACDEQEAHDAEGLGDKAIMGGGGVVGDGRLWRDGGVKRGDLRGARGEEQDRKVATTAQESQHPY